jgi:uncharacterized protein YgiB involved in biofilm formation
MSTTTKNIKRSKAISLVLISSALLVSCADEQQATKRTLYNSRAECEREWGVGDDRCISERGYYYGPHYLFLGGRGFFYPYRNGVAATNPVSAPSTARFSSDGTLRTSGISATTGISRGGFGSRGGFSSRGGFGG